MYWEQFEEFVHGYWDLKGKKKGQQDAANSLLILFTRRKIINFNISTHQEFKAIQ